jgi:hypothetical protein
MFELPSIIEPITITQKGKICSVLEKEGDQIEVKEFKNMKELEEYRLILLNRIVQAVNNPGKKAHNAN